MKIPLRVIDLGVKPYEEVLQLQRELVDLRAKGQIEDHLLLVEHSPSVVTLGRRSEPGQWAAASLPIIEVERGGGPTYHGVGQLVGYPILKLTPDRPKLREVLCYLEKTLIFALQEFGIQAACREGLTGVWVEERKIASIGISAKRWVTFHGFALNVNPDLSPFRQIKPCGLSGEVMTSMALELSASSDPVLPPIASVKKAFVHHFRQHFGYASDTRQQK